MIKKLITILAVAACSLTCYIADAQNFIGDSKTAVEIRGSSWIGDYTSLGWSVGSYSDKPAEKYYSLMLYNSSEANIQVPAGARLILKVNGEPMVLTTAYGTDYDGSTEVIYGHTSRGVPTQTVITRVFYEVTPEQANAINTYGISKYRYQIDNHVFERDNMNAAKIAKKMSAVFDKLNGRLSKMSDLSDF